MEHGPLEPTADERSRLKLAKLRRVAVYVAVAVIAVALFAALVIVFVKQRFGLLPPELRIPLGVVVLLVLSGLFVWYQYPSRRQND